MKINFNEKLFNPLFWHLRQDLLNPDIREIFIRGGSSAAKSYSTVQALQTFMLSHGFNSMIFRKNSVDIRDSIYSDFKVVDKQFGSKGLFKFQINYVEAITKAYTRFRGLDDEEKIKGLSDFNFVLMEELNQYEYKDVKQVRKRLRGRENQKIIGLWNPVDETSWVKTEIEDVEEWIEIDNFVEGRDNSTVFRKWVNKKGNKILIQTNYKDNFFVVGHPDGKTGYVDKHVIADFENDRINDYNNYLIYGLGEWGRVASGYELYKRYDPAKHLKSTKYDEMKPLHLTIDFNVVPYISASVWQMDRTGKGFKFRKIKEYCLKSPNNTTESIGKAFARDYKGHVAGVYYYGDPSGKRRDTRMQQGANDFTILHKELKDFYPKDRVLRKAPAVAARCRFMNALFHGQIEDCSIEIDNSCKHTDEEYRNVQEDMDGTKRKTRVTENGVSFEKYGHISDGDEYFLIPVLETQYKAFIGKKRKLLG